MKLVHSPIICSYYEKTIPSIFYMPFYYYSGSTCRRFMLMPSVPSAEELEQIPIWGSPCSIPQRANMFLQSPQSSVRVLELYAPPVGNLGQMGSCYCWATLCCG